jgi:acetyl esterase/lipase
MCFDIRNLLLRFGFIAAVFATTSQGMFAKDQPESLQLWPQRSSADEKQDAVVTIHQPEQPNGTAMIICPGGGYTMLMKGPEGSGIAAWLNEHGITGIVLEYRLPEGDVYRPLRDAQRAIRLARANAEKWGFEPNRLGIIGFSAGGHLASMTATHFDAGDPSATDTVERFSSRPDFCVLIYPVILMDAPTHVGSRQKLLGSDASPEKLNRFSSEKQVTAETPPCFLAHAADDTVVTPDHSEKFYDALLEHDIAATYLQLPSGGHGLNDYSGPMWEAWQTQSLNWLKEQGFVK